MTKTALMPDPPEPAKRILKMTLLADDYDLIAQAARHHGLQPSEYARFSTLLSARAHNDKAT